MDVLFLFIIVYEVIGGAGVDNLFFNLYILEYNELYLDLLKNCVNGRGFWVVFLSKYLVIKRKY